MTYKCKEGEKAITKTMCSLCSHLQVSSENSILTTYLGSKLYILPDEEEVILSNRNNAARVRKLIDYLKPRLTVPCFVDFVNAIGDSEICNNKPLKLELIEQYKRLGGDPSLFDCSDVIPRPSSGDQIPKITKIAEEEIPPEEVCLHPSSEIIASVLPLSSNIELVSNANSKYSCLFVCPEASNIYVYNCQTKKISKVLYFTDELSGDIDFVYNVDNIGILISKTLKTLVTFRDNQNRSGNDIFGHENYTVGRYECTFDYKLDMNEDVESDILCVAVLEADSPPMFIVVDKERELVIYEFNADGKLDKVGSKEMDVAVKGICASTDGSNLIAVWSDRGDVAVGPVDCNFDSKYVTEVASGKTIVNCTFIYYDNECKNLAIGVTSPSGEFEIIFWNFSNGKEDPHILSVDINMNQERFVDMFYCCHTLALVIATPRSVTILKYNNSEKVWKKESKTLSQAKADVQCFRIMGNFGGKYIVVSAYNNGQILTYSV